MSWVYFFMRELLHYGSIKCCSKIVHRHSTQPLLDDFSIAIQQVEMWLYPVTQLALERVISWIIDI